MKVKILEVTGHEFKSNDFYQTLYTNTNSLDWEEVSEEEYGLLKKWAEGKNNICRDGTKYVIVAEKEINIPKTIKEIIKKIQQEEEEKKEQQKEIEEKNKKRQMTIEKQKEKKEKKKFEELKKKFETN